MLITKPIKPPSGRHGFTLLEVIVTVIVFGVVLSLVTTLTRRAIDQRRTLDTRRAALLEVSNALEILETDPDARPAPGQQRDLPVPEILVSKLSSPELIARATSIAGTPGGVRLDVELTWMTDHNRRASPIALSSVIFPEQSTGGEP